MCQDATLSGVTLLSRLRNPGIRGFLGSNKVIECMSFDILDLPELLGPKKTITLELVIVPDSIGPKPDTVIVLNFIDYLVVSVYLIISLY